MSLKRSDARLVPEETARIAKAAFPKGALAISIRDELNLIYDDDLFADLYPTRGQPAEAPWRLAIVTVLQFAEDLSDREAALAVKARLDWKYALGLELTDTGFDASVLAKFRRRLTEGKAEHRLLDALLEACKAKDLIRKRGSARTDSTHVLAKVRALNRLGSCIETMRVALNAIAVAAPEWLKNWVSEDWFERYGPRYDHFRLPKGKEKVQSLAVQVGEDGLYLLRKLYHSESPSFLADLSSVEFLRKMWLQQYVLVDGQVSWRDPKEIASTSDLLVSPYEPEARFGSKRDIQWTGYKLHVTETCDEDKPHLISHVETSKPNRHDNQLIPSIHQALEEKDLVSELHLVDAGYMDTNLLLDSKKEYGVCLHGPLPKDQRWQSNTYAISDFKIDWDHETAFCPQDKQSISWKETLSSRGNPMIRVGFSSKDCTPCNNRHLCTRAKKQARMLGFSPKEQFDALNKARQDQKTDAWQNIYKTRSGIEGTLSQGVRAFGMRRSRYFGQTKTHFQQQAIATAINVSRLAHWFDDKPRAKTRVSRFQRLQA